MCVTTRAAYARPVHGTGPDGPESEQSRDDTDVGWGADDGGGPADDDDRRLVEERPPHHDRP